ncbi:MAG: pentapeptide repeat-containing protein [Anaerolineaceae bacterium]|nr:pentapeptide repeat-containing protein [Anaerolineaceae bacterium]
MKEHPYATDCRWTADFIKSGDSLLSAPHNKDVTDILLNRFYTELDYDVINALIMSLSQVNTEDEIVYVSQKLLDINRNFVIQKLPIRERRKIIRDIYWDLEAKYLGRLRIFETQKSADADNEEHNLSLYQPEYLDEKRDEYLHYHDLLEYKLAWHKQMVSDALGMSLLQASRRGLTKKLELTLYGNSISYSQFYDIYLNQLIIRFSDFISTSLQEVSSSETLIFSSFFDKSTIRRCNFRNGKISNVEFINTKLDTIKFENVEFEDVYFLGVELNHCDFTSVRGLNPALFYKCKITAPCKFDDEFDDSLINSVTKEQLLFDLESSPRSLFGKWLITETVNKLD